MGCNQICDCDKTGYCGAGNRLSMYILSGMVLSLTHQLDLLQYCIPVFFFFSPTMPVSPQVTSSSRLVLSSFRSFDHLIDYDFFHQVFFQGHSFRSSMFEPPFSLNEVCMYSHCFNCNYPPIFLVDPFTGALYLVTSVPQLAQVLEFFMKTRILLTPHT